MIHQHFSVTVYLFDKNGNKILLIKHKKLNIFLGAGGHIEPNESYFDAAQREVLEEVGVKDVFYPEYLYPLR